MNAAFLIMSSAALAGADPAPPPPPPAAPIVISGGAGCNNCAPAPNCGCGSGGRVGLLDRLKSRFGGFGKKSRGGDCGCPPPPSCAPPCPPPPPRCNPCPTSCDDRPNLFDKMKSRWGKKKSGGPSCCDPCAGAFTGGCVPGAPPVTPGTGTPPKEMPKPKDEKKDKGNAGLPLPPVTGVGLGGSSY